MTKNRRLATLALLGNTLIWGLAIPIVKRGFNAGLTPTQFLLARYTIALLVSFPFILIYKAKSIKKILKLKLPHIIMLEIVGTVLALWLLYEGVALTTAVESTLIAVTWPIFVVIGGVFFLKEKEERHEMLGLLLAIVGTILLVVRPLFTQGTNGSLLGNLLILSQNIAIAGYYLLAKRVYRGLDKWTITHVSFWVGFVGFSFISLIKGFSPLSELQNLLTFTSPWPIFASLYMGILGSIGGLTLYLIGQDKIEASEAAIFTYLQPLVAIPAAIILLRETVAPLEILAMIIIAFGVYLAESRKKRQKLLK